MGVTKIVFRQVKTYDAPTNYTNRHIYADLYSNSDLIETVEIVVFQAYGDVANKIISTWTSNVRLISRPDINYLVFAA